MPDALVLAIDQGTSSTKCLLLDRAGAVVARGTAPIGEEHPQPGWVDQDAAEILLSVRRAVADCLEGHDARDVVAVGIATQRAPLRRRAPSAAATPPGGAALRARLAALQGWERAGMARRPLVLDRILTMMG